MDTVSIGERVKVDAEGRVLDGIVFDTPSRSKVVVAVHDHARGPVFRTVALKTLTERTEEGPDDRALLLLIRRAARPVQGPARGGAGAGRGQSGYSRRAMHRTTGK
jgi:hypothetical protein